jgi:monovalent cation:H+ antiporter, CPA1 family
MYESFITLLAVAALLTFINIKFLKLPTTIGLMILGMCLSCFLLIVRHFDYELFVKLPHILDELDFHDFLMNILLSFLLFAGAVHIDIKTLDAVRLPVFVFAIIGTIISTFIIGYLTYFVFGLLGLNIPLLHCMLFGALISPTDPIAVLAIFKNYHFKKTLSVKIEGESLFNDGIGIVVFVTIIQLIMGDERGFSIEETGLLFLREAVGGILFGLLLGFCGLFFLKRLKKDPKTAVIITLVIATGGYAIANTLEVSGALAMVAAGLTIGNWIHKYAGIETKTLISTFWEIIGEIFNSMVFVMMGLAILLIDPIAIDFVAAIFTIIIVLIGRFISVFISRFIVRHNKFSKPWYSLKYTTVMTWSGLRGALAFALALSITPDLNGHFIIFLTYSVAAFSIIVQGLTIGKLVKKFKI